MAEANEEPGANSRPALEARMRRAAWRCWRRRWIAAVSSTMRRFAPVRRLSGSRSELEVGDDSMVAEAAADNCEIVTDVCIVGAGPAGITIARELANRGVRVCLLEAGGKDFRRRFQRQGRGESDGYPIHRLHESRVRAFGGTLRHPRIWDAGWAARPLDPIDFEARGSLPGLGWPFDRDHLSPYYTRAESVCGIRPFDVAHALWSEQAQADGPSLWTSRELESTVFQFPMTAFHDAWDVLSASSNVRLLLETRAVEIRVDSTGQRVDSIIAVRGRRDRVVIRPRLVVFAAGGIDNARLLLTANEGRGLGNEHDLVGRYFAERLSFHAGHFVLSDKASVSGLDCFHRREGGRNCWGASSCGQNPARTAPPERRLLSRAASGRCHIECGSVADDLAQGL